MDRGKKLAGWASGSTSSSLATINYLSTKESLIPSLCCGILLLVNTPFINTVTFADGACEARSRRRGRGDAGTSTTTRDKEIARNLHPSEVLGRDGPIPLLLLLADVPDIDSW